MPTLHTQIEGRQLDYSSKSMQNPLMAVECTEYDPDRGYWFAIGIFSTISDAHAMIEKLMADETDTYHYRKVKLC